MAPHAVQNDGLLDFVYIVNQTPSRTKLLEIMTSLRNGTHVEHFPFLVYKKIQAFYIEPLEKSSSSSTTSSMVVDGEVIPFGPVQGEQFQGVFTIKSQSQNTKINSTPSTHS
eukprot:c21229_g2_i2.p1 GENE.c21229_g2_i2~~c21229_g2_i2.p1  ORF type:complete len:112 (-),score=31.35 c21229_g2_i2:62-397(-)